MYSFFSYCKIVLSDFFPRVHVFHFARLFLFLFFIFLFSSVGVRIYDPLVYVTGGNNPYTSFLIYAADIFLFLSLFFWLLTLYLEPVRFKKLTFGDKHLMTFLLIFLLSLAVSLFFSINPTVSFFALLRYVEFLMAYVLVANRVLKVREIMHVLFFVFLLQALLGIYQSLYQHSMGLGFFGETFLTPNLPGVAKVALGDKNFLRSYGTFLHPNILAGWIVFLSLPLFSVRHREKLFYTTLIFLFFLVLVLTFSRTAWVALAVGFSVYYFFTKRKLHHKWLMSFLSLMLLFIVAFNAGPALFRRLWFDDPHALTQRLEYFVSSVTMFLQHPFGVGLNNFTLALSDISQKTIAPWEYQPVHNVFFLFFNEAGFFGGVIYLCLWISLAVLLLKKVSVVQSEYEKNYGYLLIGSYFVLTVLQFFDHYMVSQPSGIALLFLFFMLANEFLVHPLIRNSESL